MNRLFSILHKYYSVRLSLIALLIILFLDSSALFHGYRLVSVAACSLSLWSYYALILSLLEYSGFFSVLDSIQIKSLLIFIGILALLAVPLYFYISESRTIRYWDNGMYWYSVLEFMPSINNSVREALNNVYQSILSSDYNLLPSLLIALPMMSFRSYAAFVVVNYIFFCIPSLLMMACFLFRIVSLTDISQKHARYVYISTLLFAPVMVPVLLGFIDICCIFPLVSLYFAATNVSFLERNVIPAILIGLVSLLVVLLRRYFAYAVIGFYAYLILNNVWNLISQFNKSKSIQPLVHFVLNSFSCLCVIFILLSSVFWEFFERSFFNNYSSSYSAYYAYSNGIDRFFGYLSIIGPIYVVSSLFGLILLSSRIAKSHQYNNRLTVICFSLVFSMALTLAIFLRIQDFTIQHFYVIDIPLFILFGLSVSLLINNRIINAVLFAVSLATLLNNFGLVVFPAQLSLVLGKTLYQTQVRSDLDVIHQLDKDLEHLNSKHNGLTYVNASSGVLNQALIMRSYAPESLVTPFQLSDPCDIDLRDGFQYGFLDATYVITCDKPQTHVADVSNQSVVLYLTEMFNHDTYISRHFRLLKCYSLENGVNARLYQKVSDFSKDDLLKLKTHFMNLYPEANDLFCDRFDKYIDYHGLS